MQEFSKQTLYGDLLPDVQGRPETRNLEFKWKTELMSRHESNNWPFSLPPALTWIRLSFGYNRTNLRFESLSFYSNLPKSFNFFWYLFIYFFNFVWAFHFLFFWTRLIQSFFCYLNSLLNGLSPFFFF